MTKKVKLQAKGQITIPKKIREEDNMMQDDVFILTHTTNGEIVLRKQMIASPEDALLETIQRMPKIGWRAAWKEVEEERRRERS